MKSKKIRVDIGLYSSLYVSYSIMIISNNFIFMLLNRTKVECAGLCLTFDACYAFRFEISNEHDITCTLYEKEGVCQTNERPVEEIYAIFQDPPPKCQGIQNSAKK